MFLASPEKKKKTKSAKVHVRQAADSKNDKTVPLPQRKYGRPKHPFASRVGAVADMVKAHYKVPVSLDKTSAMSDSKPSFQGKSDSKPSSQGKSEEKPPSVQGKSDNKPEVIDLTEVDHVDLDGYDIISVEWLNIHGISLSFEDEDIIVSKPRQWLNDRHINACQKLLKEQFPMLSVLIDVLLVQYSKCRPPANVTAAVQVHHIGNHWLVSTTIGVNNNCVKVYDSMIRLCDNNLARGVNGIIDAVLVCAQRQDGPDDCGPHLRDCLEAKKCDVPPQKVWCQTKVTDVADDSVLHLPQDCEHEQNDIL